MRPRAEVPDAAKLLIDAINAIENQLDAADIANIN